MELIVAVYDDWGIGAQGDQPIALSADRKFFREVTKGSTVIVGRKTLASFPGGKPLPNRVNVVVTRGADPIPGCVICHSVEEAAAFCENAERVFVIGGGSVYRQMLPLCHRAYITKVHVTPESDTYFPDLDQDNQWECVQIIQSGQENGIAYEMCLYQRM
jgi:dihydrofolate reductase